jgi:hypothetical protein
MAHPKEVFVVMDTDSNYKQKSDGFRIEDLNKLCGIYGAVPATQDQFDKTKDDGAQWCKYGFTKDIEKAQLVLQTQEKGHCGVTVTKDEPIILKSDLPFKKYQNAVCYGVKPSESNVKTDNPVRPWFAPRQYSETNKGVEGVIWNAPNTKKSSNVFKIINIILLLIIIMASLYVLYKVMMK